MRRPTLRFLGGVGTVTGSKFLLETASSRVLIDCGLFQGHKALRLRNREPLAIRPSRIDAVVITHAHLDHIGFLPALVRSGFTGAVHATRGTVELGSIVLADAARLQEEDAAYANRVGSTRHAVAGPLFDADDAERASAMLNAHDMGTSIRVTTDVAVTFRRAGHILGSSSVVVSVDGHGSFIVSGDLGRDNHPLLLPPEPIGDAGSGSPIESIVVESTYGARTHEATDPVAQLAAAVNETAARGGTVIIPSFAVDRTEVLLLHIRELVHSRQIPDLPVFVDSPMALNGLRVYRRAILERWPEIRSGLGGGGDPFETGRLQECRTVEESKAINAVRYPSIIIAASGMATGGRVLHHLANRLPDPRNTVVLVGYQVAGTRGRQLAEGARELKIFGDFVDVRARIEEIAGFTVHAGRAELLAWLGTAVAPPRSCFVVHGEPPDSASLCASIRGELGFRAFVARDDEVVNIAHRQP